MNRFANILTQIAFVAAASLSSMVMLQASTANAQAPALSNDGYFRAELASPVEKTTKIIQGVVWQCEGTVCNGARATSRPINVCTRLSRKFGDVTAFSARNEPMTAEDIASCNAEG